MVARRCSRALPAPILFVLLLAPQAGGAQVATPFRTRDFNPLLTAFALPSWPVLGASAGRSVGVISDLANYYRFSRDGGETITLDGEIWRTALELRWQLAGDGVLAVELPYYRQFGGVLDDVIDGWHSAFHLPDEGRNARPQDQLQYRLEGGQGVAVNLDRLGSGWGDLQLSFARPLAGGALTWQVMLQLPTGDPDLLAGGVGPGAALTLSGGQSGRWRARESGLYWGGGVVLPSDPELVGFATRSVAAVGVVGGGWQAWPRLGLKAQLDLHGPFYDSALKEIGATSVQASLGGWWNGRESRAIEFAVTEDLGVGTAADVALHVDLRWGW